MTKNDGLPSMVDKSKFTVGENLGGEPGQGRLRRGPPRADPVRAADRRGLRRARCSSCRRRSTSSTSGTSRPAARSSSTWSRQGHQVFIVSWRNPTRGAGRLGPRELRRGARPRHRGRLRDLGLARPQPRRRLLGRHHRGAAAGALGRTRRRAGGSLSLFVAILDIAGGEGHLDGPLRQLRDAASSRGCSRAPRACSRARTSSGPSPGCGRTT